MVTFSMTFTDPLPGFQGHGIFEVEYVKNVLSYGQNYYSTVIEMVPCLVTLNDL